MHKLSGKLYVGSSFNLSRRFSQYYTKSYLQQNKTRYICNALSHHGHSEFSFYIIKYINIYDISEKEALKQLLLHEQNFLDLINPEYNILKVAGSSLGSKHTEESLTKMSGENNHMFGKTHSTETLALMCESKKAENHPMYGKSHSSETLLKISEAMKGKNLGKLHSPETKEKMSLAKKGIAKSAEHKEKIKRACKGLNTKKVFVYTKDPVSKYITLYKCFDSFR